MVPGETGELFDELSGDGSGEKLPEYCPLCGEAEGAEKHRCRSNRKKLESEGWVFGSAEDFLNAANFIQVGDEGEEVEGKTTVSNSYHDYGHHVYGGYICHNCGEFVRWNESHVCKGWATDKQKYDTNGYECVFCGAWVDFSEVHMCLYDKSQQMLKLQAILKEMKEIKDGIHYLLQEIRKVQNGL